MRPKGAKYIGKGAYFELKEPRCEALDAGLMFPDHEELGIQKVLPDVSFLARWKDKVEAVLITHGRGSHSSTSRLALSRGFAQTS